MDNFIHLAIRRLFFNSMIGLRAHGHTNKNTLLITDGQPAALSKTAYEQVIEVGEKDLPEESVMLEVKRAPVSS